MFETKSYKNTFAILSIALLLISLINISLGSVYIPFKQIIAIFFNQEVDDESWRTIVLNLRLPKAITAIIVTHELRIVQDVADRVILLHEGKIAFDGLPDKIQKSKDPVVKQFITGDSTLILQEKS